MPIYEYRCNSCQKVASIFFRSFSAATDPVCPSCNSADMRKLISRTFIVKSEADRWSSMDVERGLSRLANPHDPGAVARWAEEMGKDLGGDMGQEFRDMAEKVTDEDRPPELYDAGYYYQSRVNQARMEAEGKGSGDEGSGGGDDNPWGAP